MPTLKNDRHEKFCHALVQGNSKADAYIIAGYKASQANCSTLAKRQDIQDRLAELQGRAADLAVSVAGISTGISKAWVLESLRANAVKGLKEKKSSSVANRALELIGKELGMFLERIEQGRPGDFAHLSDEELDAQMKQRLKARGLNDRQIRNFLLVTNPTPANYDEKESG